MNLAGIKSTILELSDEDQKRFITEVVPLLWPQVYLDDLCVAKMKELVDEARMKKFLGQIMGCL